MKCVLHIGLMKTGTTLLQNWLYQNRVALSRQRVWLSDSLGKPDNYLFTAYFNDELDDWSRYMNIPTLEQRRAYFHGFLDKLRSEIEVQSRTHDVFVLTAKNLNFSMSSKQRFAALSRFLAENFDEIKVVCCFRNQFDFAVSAYNEKVKSGQVMSLETYVESVGPEDYHFNYLSIADNWSAAFGRDACEFKLFDRSRFFEGDVRKDFIRSLPCDVNLEALDFKLESANESLAPLVASGFRAINTVIPAWDPETGRVNQRNLDFKALVNSVSSLKAGKFVSSRRQEIEDRFDAVNTAFFSKYFGTSNLFRSDQAEVREEARFSLAEVEGIVFDLLKSLLPFTTQGKSLGDPDAALLRDIALKIEGKAPLGISEALALMKLAQRVRPDDPLIEQKVLEYGKDYL